MVGTRTKFEFNKRNQFDFIYLCDLFDVRYLTFTYLYVAKKYKVNSDELPISKC